MLGVKAIADAAKDVLGGQMLVDPLRVSCPECDHFVVAVLSVPILVRGRCSRCRVDVVILIASNQERMIATDK